MNVIPTYYQGSSFALLLRAHNKGDSASIPLNDYHIEAIIYSKLLGSKIKLSSADDAPLKLTPLNKTTFYVSIPATATATLPVGECSIQLTMTHKTSGEMIRCSTPICLIEYSVND